MTEGQVFSSYSLAIEYKSVRCVKDAMKDLVLRECKEEFTIIKGGKQTLEQI